MSILVFAFGPAPALPQSLPKSGPTRARSRRHLRPSSAAPGNRGGGGDGGGGRAAVRRTRQVELPGETAAGGLRRLQLPHTRVKYWSSIRTSESNTGQTSARIRIKGSQSPGAKARAAAHERTLRARENTPHQRTREPTQGRGPGTAAPPRRAPGSGRRFGVGFAATLSSSTPLPPSTPVPHYHLVPLVPGLEPGTRASPPALPRPGPAAPRTPGPGSLSLLRATPPPHGHANGHTWPGVASLSLHLLHS